MNLLQNEILNIYKEIANICARNGLDYFAIGGTCLGTIRHQGFIPWDDDRDLAIPIEQFDRFKECMKKELPEHLYLYDCEDIREYRYIFSKICNRNTAFIEESERPYPHAYKGLFVDIMPISGVPDNHKYQSEFVDKVRTYYRLNYIFRYPWKAMDNWKQKTMWIILHACFFHKPYNYFSHKWMEMLMTQPFVSAKKVGYVWSTSIKRLIFPKEWFSKHVELTFEDTIMRCPIGYDKYLTQQFGDYMELPPENERLQHHPYIVDLEHSYVEYTDKRKER